MPLERSTTRQSSYECLGGGSLVVLRQRVRSVGLDVEHRPLRCRVPEEGNRAAEAVVGQCVALAPQVAVTDQQFESTAEIQRAADADCALFILCAGADAAGAALAFRYAQALAAPG